MKEPKLTPDQLHRLIDEVAELAYRKHVSRSYIGHKVCKQGFNQWWFTHGVVAYQRGYGQCDGTHAQSQFAGLSAVLILLSEGG